MERCAGPRPGSHYNGGGTDWVFRDDGRPATSASLGFVAEVALDGAGNVFAADVGNNLVVKISPGGTLTVVAGNGICEFSGDGGPARNASLGEPNDVAVDADGNIYIADTGNGRIRRVSANGIISTVAGNGDFAFSGDGGPATSASLFVPQGVAVDAGGNLYISDTGNHRVRRVTPAGVISTVVGTGEPGFSGDGGPAADAMLIQPVGLAFDSSGNLYIADGGNDRIRKVTPAGIITTVAGGGDTVGDGGPAAAARINEPTGVAVSAAGDVYFSDTNNLRIRKVTSGGTISTIAGNGNFKFSGDGGPATSAALNSPSSVAVDILGNLYIADEFNQRIRKISSDGIITTVAGTGERVFSGDGGPATSVSLASPKGVALDAVGNFYIADHCCPAKTRTESTGWGF